MLSPAQRPPDAVAPQAVAAPRADAFPRRAVLAFTALGLAYLGIFGYRIHGFMDSDEAIFGIMARHILYRHELPVFYWGQEYLGAVESYLVAPLIWLFGDHAECMRVVTDAIYLLAIPAAADVAYMASGRRLAWITAAVLATPPLAFTVWISKMHMFAEAGAASFLILWLALKVAALTRGRKQLLAAASLGLLVGVGLWWSYLVVVYALPGALVMVLHPNARRLKVWALVAALMVVGCAPALYRNAFVTHWATVVHAVHPDASQAAVGQPDHAVPALAWRNLTTIAFPAMLGFHDARIVPYKYELPSALWQTLLILLAVLGAVACVQHALGRGRTLLARLAAVGPLLGGLAMVVLYVFSRFGFEPEPRYVMPLYLAVGCLNAWGIDWIATRWRWPGTAALAALMLFMIWGTFFVEPAPQVAFWKPGVLYNTDYHALSDRLVALGIHHMYGDYWAMARLDFDSDERVLAADRGGRMPEWLQREIFSDPKACTLGPRWAMDGRVPRGWRRYDFGTDVPGILDPLVVICPP